MPANAMEAILQNRPRLGQALDENHDVSTFFHAVFVQLARVAATEQKDPSRVRLSPFVDDAGLHVTILWPEGTWRSNLKLFAAMNDQIAQILGRNPSTISFIERTLHLLHRWASENKVPFWDLRIEEAKLIRGNRLIFGKLSCGKALLERKFS